MKRKAENDARCRGERMRNRRSVHPLRPPGQRAGDSKTPQSPVLHSAYQPATRCQITNLSRCLRHFSSQPRASHVACRWKRLTVRVPRPVLGWGFHRLAQPGIFLRRPHHTVTEGVSTRLWQIALIGLPHDSEGPAVAACQRPMAPVIRLLLGLTTVLAGGVKSPLHAAAVRRSKQRQVTCGTGPDDELAPPAAGLGDALPVGPHRFVVDAKTPAKRRGGFARISPGDGRVLLVGERCAFRAHGGIVATTHAVHSP